MRGRLTVLMLVVLVALDVVLVTLAVRHTYAPAPGDAASVGSSAGSGAPSPSAAPTTAPSDPSTSAGSPSTSPDESSGEPAPPKFLAVGPESLVVGASRGRCDGAVPRVVLSRDGGKPAEVGVDDLGEVLGLRAESDDTIVLLGLNGSCDLATFRSTDGGESWTQESGAPGWHVSRSRRKASVSSPSGTNDTPCDPRSLSAVDDRVARLLCREGTVLGTSDGGASWVALGRLDGATTADFTAPGDGFALAREERCSAAVLQTSDGGATWSDRTCLKGKLGRAIASDGDRVAAQVGDRLYLSVDGGATWSRLSG